MTDKEHFIDIMNRIRVGSKILYVNDFNYINNNEKIKEAVVVKIISCKTDYHEGCKHCVGYIYLYPHHGNRCFKKCGKWLTCIIDVINDIDFFSEEEFIIK